MSSILGKPQQTRVYRESLVGCTLHEGEYYVERILGHGGMGNVYLATYTPLNTPLALKQARADQPLPESVVAELEFLLRGGSDSHHYSTRLFQEQNFPSSGGIHTDRFLREALLLARLQHPGIPALYDYFLEDGFWYLVMDYIPGSPLNAYLRQQAPLPPLEAINYTMQLCDILDYLHRQAPVVVFRDLKPANLILTPDNTLMLVDFGIARYFKEGQANDTAEFGSPGYASPEQYQGEGQTDSRSDLFSLGIILREMVTGRLPKSVRSTGNLLEGSAPAASAVLNGLIKLATRNEPTYRYQSAHTFYLALERVHRIEERRAYRCLIQEAQEKGEIPTQIIRKPDIAPTPTRPPHSQDMALGNMQADPTLIPSVALKLGQRRKIRAAIHQTRAERIEQIDLETQLASVDESLKRRAIVPLMQDTNTQSEAIDTGEELQVLPTPVPIPSLPTHKQQFIRHKKQDKLQNTRRMQSLLKVCFVITLILFLSLISLLSYLHFTDTQLVPEPGLQTLPVVTDSTGEPNGAALPALTATATSNQNVRGSWQALASLTQPQADNSMVYVQVQGRGYLYLTGGYLGSDRKPGYDRNLYRYDIEAARWETVKHEGFPGMLNNSAVADEKGHIFFTAGYSTYTNKVTSRLYRYQPAENSLSVINPPADIPVGFGGAIILDQQGHLYVSQGFMQAGRPGEKAGTGWYRYDIAEDRWHQLSPLPVGLGYAHLALDSKGNILFLGGSTDAGLQHQPNQAYRYMVAENSWLQETLPYSFSGTMACELAPQRLVVIGGYDQRNKIGQDQTLLINVDTLAAQSLPTLPAGGSALGAAACDGKGHVYLERGTSDLVNPTADFWQFSAENI